MLWEQGVVGSNPATPTIIKPLIIRYPLIVSGYFLALYLNIKTLNNQQCKGQSENGSVRKLGCNFIKWI